MVNGDLFYETDKALCKDGSPDHLVELVYAKDFSDVELSAVNEQLAVMQCVDCGMEFGFNVPDE